MVKKTIVIAVAAALLWWMRGWIWQVASQVLWGMLIALAAWPMMKRLQRRMKSGPAAAVSLMSLVVIVLVGVWLIAPPLIRQARELGAMLPSLLGRLEGYAIRLRETFFWQPSLGGKAQEMILSTVGSVASWLGGLVGNIGQAMLAPVIAFYLLRDRLAISRAFLALLPEEWRELCVRILREIRRETAGYLRGQWMVCASVGGATAVGLLLCGVPSWLVLGVMMGLLEWIPYVGPIVGGAAAVAFALPGGLGRTLWVLAVVTLVQQAEGVFLSPRLMSGATRLHPLAVVLCVAAGGAAAGMTGVLLSVPLLLSMRAVWRVLRLAQFDVPKVFSKP